MRHPNPDIEAILSQLAKSYSHAKIDLSLDRITTMLAAIGNPQDQIPSVIHVAGTNGKGSLLAYLTSIFQAAGYKVNRLTSPYLVKFNEEIILSDKEIEDDYLLSLLKKVLALASDHPVTYFEATTAAAFLAFEQNKADVTLLETGLGGRLDATNMVRLPLLTAITPISIDHSEFLGDTIAKIAAEKAGIIKANVPCVVGKQEADALQVIEAKAKEMNAPLYRYNKEWNFTEHEGRWFTYESTKRAHSFPIPNLEGAHQLYNAATAIACIDSFAGFNITNDHIAEGITNALWPARLQKISQGKFVKLLPENAELWLDGGHNPGAGLVLADWIKAQKKPVHLICGILQNKDAEHILLPLAPLIKSMTTIPFEAKQPGYNPIDLAQVGQKIGIPSHPSTRIEKAISSIVEAERSISRDYAILICGSLYLAGNILLENGAEP